MQSTASVICGQRAKTNCAFVSTSTRSCLMMTQEVPELFGLTHLSEYGISHLSGNVVLLQFLRGNSEVKRAISVLKTRGSAHDPRIRHFEITSDGLSLGDPFLPDQSLL